MEYTYVLLRSLIAAGVLILVIRLMGKRQVGELSVVDFVIAITIGSIASTASVELENAGIKTAFGIVVWGGIAWLLARGGLHNRWIDRTMSGKPRVLVEAGHIDQHALRQEHMTIDNLLMQLRKQGAFDLKEVEAAVLEVDGTLSVLKRSQHTPVTPQDLNMSTQYKGLPIILIKDGDVQEENLTKADLSPQWLRNELSAQGIHDAGHVIYAAIDTAGTLYVDHERTEEHR